MAPSPLDAGIARTIWHRLETINAVTYFSPECLEAQADLGMQGFWMGYFAARAAPLGPVGPAVVEATFVNFHPDRVRRALPDAWRHASPDEVVRARQDAAASVLRRLLPGGRAERLADAVAALLDGAIAAGASAARPLFAANRAVATPDDPVAALWQSATTLREHRGDGHVALIAGAGLDGCEVLVLFAADTSTDAGLFQQSRGWSGDEWAAAVDRLRGRGLLDRDGAVSAVGRALRETIETRTDELAIAPYAHLASETAEGLIELLTPAATTIAGSGEISFPNPMGLPRVDAAD